MRGLSGASGGVRRMLSKICRAMLDAFVFTFDADLTVPRQHLHSERIANLPQVLVSTTENCQLLGVSVQVNRGFWHASPRNDPGGIATPIAAKGSAPIKPHEPIIIMLLNRERKQYPENSIEDLRARPRSAKANLQAAARQYLASSTRMSSGPG